MPLLSRACLKQQSRQSVAQRLFYTTLKSAVLSFFSSSPSSSSSSPSSSSSSSSSSPSPSSSSSSSSSSQSGGETAARGGGGAEAAAEARALGAGQGENRIPEAHPRWREKQLSLFGRQCDVLLRKFVSTIIKTTGVLPRQARDKRVGKALPLLS